MFLPRDSFHLAFDHSPFGMGLLGMDRRWIKVNLAFSALTGYSTDELLDLGYVGLIEQPDAARVTAFVEAVSAGPNESARIETRFKRRDGTPLHILLYLSKFADRDKSFCVAQIEDLTERKRALEALEANETLLKQFVQYAPAAIAMLDNDMRYVQVSDRWIRDYHLTGREIIGLRHYEVFPDIPERWRRIHSQVLAGAVDKCDEDPFPRDDGGLEWLQWEARPWYTVGGKIGGLIFFTQVITARKEAEEALRVSEERFRSAVEYSPVGFALVSLDRNFLQVNRALCEIVGYRAEELLAKNADDITHPDDLSAHVESQRGLIAGRITHIHLEKRYVHKTGRTIWVQLSVSLVRNLASQPLHFVIQVQDITESRLAEAKRETLVAELQAKAAEMERFTYTVSHDLKSPLITIKSFLGMVERDIASGNLTRATGDLERIGKAADKMNQLLEELLRLSRVGRILNTPERVPYGELVQEALDLVAGQIMQKNVEIRVGKNFPSVVVDRPRIIEVLQNLIDNAVKFSGDGPQSQVTIGSEMGEAETRFFVRDNGIGIQSQHQEQIFGLFDKLNPSSEGSGVGLALVKRIVEVHGGRIWVESEGPGMGSTFWFTLGNPQNLEGAR